MNTHMDLEALWTPSVTKSCITAECRSATDKETHFLRGTWYMGPTWLWATHTCSFPIDALCISVISSSQAVLRAKVTSWYFKDVSLLILVRCRALAFPITVITENLRNTKRSWVWGDPGLHGVLGQPGLCNKTLSLNSKNENKSGKETWGTKFKTVTQAHRPTANLYNGSVRYNSYAIKVILGNGTSPRGLVYLCICTVALLLTPGYFCPVPQCWEISSTLYQNCKGNTNWETPDLNSRMFLSS